MSKSTIDDITSRKLATILHARNYVDTTKDKHSAKPQRDAVSHEEALNTEIRVNQALVDILVAKGIISREELLERIEEIRTAR
jgi:hypothetical protein